MTATQIIRKMAGAEPTSAPLPVCEVCNDTGVVLIDSYPAAPAGFEDGRFCTCYNGTVKWRAIERLVKLIVFFLDNEPQPPSFI
jgi:hypothetical protein